MGGGLENLPALVEQLSRSATLIGVPPKSLVRVKNPFEVAEFLHQNGVYVPRLSLSWNDVQQRKLWLQKPLKSSGGHHIAIASSAGPTSTDVYFQEFIAGESYAAIFLSNDGNPATAQLIGVTRQLVGIEHFTDRRFAYCGSIGPVELPAELETELDRIGRLLATEFNLIGVFGIDVVICSSTIHVIEINPRVTASCENLEMAGYCPCIVKLHWQSSMGQFEPDALGASRVRQNKLVGKATVFSRSSQPQDVSPEAHFELVRRREGQSGRRVFADIPMPGSTIPVGGPMCTVFAYAERESTVLERLRQRADQAREIFGFGPPPSAIVPVSPPIARFD
jgi:predicted ATP-grasp superfamily ATP-dependent carboligase